MKLASFSTQILNVPEDDPLAGAIETPGATRPGGDAEPAHR